MSMSVYRVEVEQHTKDGALWAEEAFGVKARTGLEALRQVLRLSRRNGFIKSRPIEVRSMKRMMANLQ